MTINKRCPPGVFCIENVTMIFIFLIVIIALFVIIYLMYNFLTKTLFNQLNNNINNNNNNNNTETYNDNNKNSLMGNIFGLFTRPNYGYTNIPGDVLMNPYAPPLRDERYLIPEIQMGMAPPGRVPINISTNIGAVDTTYRQVGILTPLNSFNRKGNHGNNGDSKILPLMGRPLFTNRDKWQYYTISDQNNSVKLPIKFKGRNASNEYGVDKIYNGDIVYVEGYQQAFKVTEYENDTIKYLPFL